MIKTAKILLNFSIVLSLFSSLNANEHRVVLHGTAKHLKSTDVMGRVYNEENYGIGYEYNTFKKENKWYVPVWTVSANIIKDSYKEVFPFVGGGIELRTKGIYAIGLTTSVFIGVKKISHYLNNNGVYTENSP